MHLGTALLLGLLGGVHCAGMCGPLMLALPWVGNTRAQEVAGRLIYQGGRVLTYTAMGWVAGWIGRGLLWAGVQQAVTLTLGVLLLASLFAGPWLSAAAVPVRAVAFLKRGMATMLRHRGFASMGLLGTLNGLLPCGLVYAACVGAATTDNAPAGALYMLTFGLATFPVTLAISLSGRLLPMAWRLRLRHLVPVTVGLVGTLLVLRGLSLGIPYLSPDLSGGGPNCCVAR
ncbi:MAG: sulfite exporter TauE/SafE family protein [Verrucomicrobiales bacterium]|nr:sulfite exporter TauE/SafE family protein [Verrucomicrobiales bacterium]